MTAVEAGNRNINRDVRHVDSDVRHIHGEGRHMRRDRRIDVDGRCRGHEMMGIDGTARHDIRMSRRAGHVDVRVRHVVLDIGQMTR
ncbi:MAG: hypothetical protein ABSC06_14085 [Rhodopila sp.]